jgi:hypothetical protein
MLIGRAGSDGMH